MCALSERSSESVRGATRQLFCTFFTKWPKEVALLFSRLARRQQHSLLKENPSMRFGEGASGAPAARISVGTSVDGPAAERKRSKTPVGRETVAAARQRLKLVK